MTKTKFFIVATLLIATGVMLADIANAMDMLAAPEDAVLNIIQKVLNMLSEFLSQVFNSFADAVKRVWQPSNGAA